MSDAKPEFVHKDAPWMQETVRFNGIALSLYRTEADPALIKGWTENPRTEMVITRWRRAGSRSDSAHPDDDEMLELMLEDDRLAEKKGQVTFGIEKLGKDLKLNGVRTPLVSSWNGRLLDGNRRKFATMWALSARGAPTSAEKALLDRIPVFVMQKDARDSHEQAILIQENYSESLKKAWPDIVTNRKLFERYREISTAQPTQTDKDIRQELNKEFPAYGVTDIRNRVETWELTEEFRADYADELGESELERKINNTFQYFRQGHDTFRNKREYKEQGFKGLLFQGIRHELFPSFAAVRDLDDIFASENATEIFQNGEGMGSKQRAVNFKLARDEANRESAQKNLAVDSRIQEFIGFFKNLTSTELAGLSQELRDSLQEALDRVIAQATASAKP